MKVTEIKNGYIKIESEKEVCSADFLLIKDIDKNYIVQVIQTKISGENFLVYTKPLFMFDEELAPYDKTAPHVESEVVEFPKENIFKHLKPKTTIVTGLFNDDSPIAIDAEFFNKLLVSSDNPANTNTIVKNLTKSVPGYVIVDLQGVFEGEKYTAGRDFKLPLNKDSLAFIYEDCLNDATTESKNLIRDIFVDLAEYSKTVEFLPFGALKSIVDDMVDNSHVFKLLVLKNKLAKFEKLGYFAINDSEVKNLNTLIDKKSCILDLSKLDTTFKNRYLETILSITETKDEKPYIFINASNNIDKKNIKNIIQNQNLNTIFITNSRFKYLNEIKTMFKNFIIEPSFTNNEVFKNFASLLNFMPKNAYMLIGNSTGRIPFVSVIKDFPEEIIKPFGTELSNIKPDQSEEQSEEVLAINQKSEEFIEQLSTEVEKSEISESENLFEEDAADIEDDTVVSESFNTETEFHTSVDTTNIENLEEFPSEEEEINTEVISDIIPEVETVSETLPVEQENFAEEPIEIELDKDTASLIEDSELEVSNNVENFEDITLNQEFMGTEKETEEENVPEKISNTESDTAETDIIETNEPLIEEEIQSVENDDSDFDEIVVLDDDEEIPDGDVLIDLTEEDSQEDALDKEIVEDVDKVFTTIKEDEEISDDDLDLIDELNGEFTAETVTPEIIEEAPVELNDNGQFEELTDYSTTEEEDGGFIAPLEETSDTLEPVEEEKEILETRSATTPIVPVYDAEIPQEDIVVSDPIEQGDAVYHAKYGSGVVEKMIKYGTKNLYSINFDNVGRRLLDPTLTEIKKA